MCSSGGPHGSRGDRSTWRAGGWAGLAALLLATVPSVGGQDLAAGMSPAQEWEVISAVGTRRVFNLGIGSLFNFASRQFTMQNKSLDADLQSELVSPSTPQMVSGIVREFSYCWRYIAASARTCTTAETAAGECQSLGAFSEVFEDEYESLREREADYELLPVIPQLPLPSGIPPTSFFFAWGSSRLDSDGSLQDMSCPMHGHTVIPVFRSQAYWDFIIGGILAWDGQLQSTRRYTWDLDAELTRHEDWMRPRVASFPSLSYAERRRIAVDVVRTTAFTGPEAAWKDDRLCPFTGNALMTPTAELRYPQAVLDTIDAEAVGTAAPLSTPLLRGVIDEILEEGGWRISDREALDCSTASARIPRDEWDTNPYWDDLRTWQLEHLGSPGRRPYTGTDSEEDGVGSRCADFENPFACEHEHSSGLYCLWHEQSGLFGECVDGGVTPQAVQTMLAVAAALIVLSAAIHFATKWRAKAYITKAQGHETEAARAAVEEVTPLADAPRSATRLRSMEPESNP